MVTAGKKFSSAVTVACGWLVGSVLALFLLAPAGLPLIQGSATLPSVIALLAIPVVIVAGGTATIGLLRLFLGWPKLPLPKLSALTLLASVFGLAALPLHSLFWLALLCNLLAAGMAAVLAWRASAEGSLGTHLFPGSTLDPAASKPNGRDPHT